MVKFCKIDCVQSQLFSFVLLNSTLSIICDQQDIAILLVPDQVCVYYRILKEMHYVLWRFELGWVDDIFDL